MLLIIGIIVFNNFRLIDENKIDYPNDELKNLIYYLNFFKINFIVFERI